ncbi:glycerate kinase type-2 family protein [Thiohalomonas denitrificans]|uniref:glycerate kinase type-2 family protein n=1 Tax=Thiohalomonas denitrificans TaxID=415747 RepID=UPI0026E9CB2A|nr:DUF4147 domain-containing protein [Thiohalomonas denitrificans]
MDDFGSEQRQRLLAVYRTTIDAVAGDRVARDYLEKEPPAADAVVVAVGKAAERMMKGAAEALGDRFQKGLVITKHDHLGAACDDPRVECLSAGHPVPDEASLRAGRRLLEFLAEVPRRSELLFFVSGGTSALVEVLPEGVGLAELERATGWLLGSGRDIEAVNRVRKGLSCIKAGRLARYLAVRHTRNLMMSDVPDDDPKVIGSGLLVPHPPESLSIEFDIPDWLQQLLGRVPKAPDPADPCFAPLETRVLISNRNAREAAAAEAARAGLKSRVDERVFTGNALEMGRRFGKQLTGAEPGLYVWGGESTVELPDEPGRGGRNQTLALAAATEIAGRNDIFLLAAGSDGTDGPTNDAGALVDGGTVQRGQEEGFDPDEALRRADSGSFLEASGDLIHTGPTGTNVMDLVLGLKV